MSLVLDKVAEAEVAITKIILALEDEIQQDIKGISMADCFIQDGKERMLVRKIAIELNENSGTPWHTGSWNEIV